MKFRLVRKGNFTTVHNINVEDRSLSWKAKGVHLYLMSRPTDWSIRQADLIRRSKDGKDSLRTGMKELIDAKYVHRRRVYENGRIVRWDYEVYEEPTDYPSWENELLPELLEAENPHQEILKSENQEEENQEEENPSIYQYNSTNNNHFKNVPKGTLVRPKGRSSKKTIRLRIKTKPAKPKTKNGLLFDSKDPKKRKKGNGIDLSKWLDFELNIGADYERPIIDLQTYLYAKKVKPAQAEVKEVLSYWNKVATEMSNNGHSLSRHEISESKVVYMFQLIVTGILHSTEFTVEDIKKAIDNYAWILNNSPWYNTIYTFPRFFGNKNLFENCITDNVKDNKSYVNRGNKAKKLTGDLLVDEIRRYHRRKYGNEDDFMEYWNGYYKLLVNRGEIQSVEDFHKFH